MQAFERLCRERGVSLTIQRRNVLEALLDGKAHPTADELFADVENRIPGISRTTVYRVLDTLVELGVIGKVYQPGEAAFFDVNTHAHHHAACVLCNKIVDLEGALPNAPIPPDLKPHGFEITESHVFFRGICRDCRKKKPRPRGTAGTGSRCSRTKPSRPKNKSSSKKRTRP